jgi:serine/threonine-protein kinase
METIETLGKYEIKRPLGRGAMGIVYEGWDPIIARRVAIKTVRLPDASDPETEEALARFRREAQAAGRLTHPNIVAVFDYGETNDLAYIVMEFVDGPPLKAVLDKQERFELATTVRIMEDLLAGLQFSHDRGVVHRDIKPANVMLTSTGQAKIADFGIARIESSSMTQAGTVLGTPAYMSPEQFMGQVVDARSDIYSSGVLLYQLLTGERPFEGGMSAIMHKALNTEPPAPSLLSVTAPPSFDAVVRRAMAKRPEDRFASATAFIEAIRTALTKQAEPADEDEATMVAAPQPGVASVAPRPVAPVVAKPAARSMMPMIAAAVVVLLGAGGGAWWILQHQQAPVQTAAVTAPVIGANSVPAPAPAPVPPVATSAPTPARVPAPPPIPPDPSAVSAAPVRPVPETTVASVPPAPTPSAPTEANQQQGAVTSVAPTLPQQPATPIAPPPAPVAAVQPPPQPPPSPAPAVQPSSQQVAIAAVGVDGVRRQIAQWASSRNCALLGGDVHDGGAVSLSGLAGKAELDDVRRGVPGIASPTDIDWDVKGVDPFYCPTLDMLRPIVPVFGATGGPRLSLQMANNRTRLHDGDKVRVRLVMPDFPSQLDVDYIAHDGSVQHLYPQLADPANGIQSDPLRTYPAGEIVNLGHPSWAISEPYGTDMIIAIASTEPLFDHRRPHNAETAEVYLRDLGAAIEKARARGVRMVGAAVTLEALPK